MLLLLLFLLCINLVSWELSTLRTFNDKSIFWQIFFHYWNANVNQISMSLCLYFIQQIYLSKLARVKIKLNQCELYTYQTAINFAYQESIIDFCEHSSGSLSITVILCVYVYLCCFKSHRLLMCSLTEIAFYLFFQPLSFYVSICVTPSFSFLHSCNQK